MATSMKPPPRKTTSIGEVLRLHTRYIRDHLVPILGKHAKLSHSDSVSLRSIFKSLDAIPMTLDLIRFSRIEKALMVIANSGDGGWPMDLQVQAEELIAKWEVELGPLKKIRADLYGPGGRMEGVKKITYKDGLVPDDELNSAWSVEGELEPSRAHAFGHLGFEVGDWWLKPAAAYRDGIIDETAHGITANENGAYAIVLTGNCETDLGREREIKYRAAIDDPGVFRLTKTMLREDPDEKVVRVLRSWKLKSKIAPKAGLRYDGLYRILSFSVLLSPPSTWHTAFTLSRIANQPSLLPALHVPTSDQLDDWKDYQRLKLIDRGDDFAMLREMLAQPRDADEGTDDIYNIKDERHGSEDSGYYSVKGSKTIITSGRRESIFTREIGEVIEGIEGRHVHVRNDDEMAEEADDEGAGLEDLDGMVRREEAIDDRKRRLNNNRPGDEHEGTAAKSGFQKHVRVHTREKIYHPFPQMGNRFISVRKPAEPRLSADEALVARGKYLGEGE